eukprot:gnl/Spiro4/14717_TR7925_c1_g1_i1.p1 gnl/Spiro4/14717_TR7925_c1_g1~~gnl/Spiro4/14717_TR7925_c1_g1_i1.p1  ORF type:complete len:447 (-),score=146.42 gnl/Spiro4/14717_TR7925_c1_g1_i1:120-1388(-)
MTTTTTTTTTVTTTTATAATTTATAEGTQTLATSSISAADTATSSSQVAMQVDASADAQSSDSVEDQSTVDLPVDCELYSCMWTLQDYFRNPPALYGPDSWTGFMRCATHVIDNFEHNTLRQYTMSSSSSPRTPPDTGPTFYFPKFVTAPQLLRLQTNNIGFRREILVQFLIVAQYLALNQPKSFPPLNEKQRTQLTNLRTKAQALLGASGPDFYPRIAKILEREHSWTVWKLEQCKPIFERAPDLSLSSSASASSAAAASGVKRKPDQPLESNSKRARPCGLAVSVARTPVSLDSVSLNAPVKPTGELYAKEAMEDLDPAAGIEAEYHKFINQTWKWKALRLFALSAMGSMRSLATATTETEFAAELAKAYRLAPTATSETAEMADAGSARSAAAAAGTALEADAVDDASAALMEVVEVCD